MYIMTTIYFTLSGLVFFFFFCRFLSQRDLLAGGIISTWHDSDDINMRFEGASRFPKRSRAEKMIKLKKITNSTDVME